MNDMMAVIWHKHKDTFFQALSSIRNSEEYCDATIACDGHFYKVHKFIMSTCSEYFNKMFKEANSQGGWFSHPVIVLQDIQHKQLEALLDYMYQGEVNVLKDELSGVLKVAQGLKIKGIGVSADNQENEIYYENEMEDSNELRPRKERLLRNYERHNSSHSVPEKRLQVNLNRLEINKGGTPEKRYANENIQNASEFKIKEKKSVNCRAKKIKIEAGKPNNEINLSASQSSAEKDSVTHFRAMNIKEYKLDKPGCSSQKKRKGKRGRQPIPVCSKILESDYKSPADVWVQSFKNLVKGVACPFCKKVYHNKSNFIYHYEGHNPTTLTCSNCPFTSKRRRELTKHIQTGHINQFLVCPHCPNTFQSKFDLTKHINTCQSITQINQSISDMCQKGPYIQEPQKYPNEDGMDKGTLHLDITGSSGVELTGSSGAKLTGSSGVELTGSSGAELNKIFSEEHHDNINERMTMIDIYWPSTDIEESTN